MPKVLDNVHVCTCDIWHNVPLPILAMCDEKLNSKQLKFIHAGCHIDVSQYLRVLSTKCVCDSIFRLEVQSAATLIEYLTGHHQELLPVYEVMMAKYNYLLV